MDITHIGTGTFRESCSVFDGFLSSHFRSNKANRLFVLLHCTRSTEHRAHRAQSTENTKMFHRSFCMRSFLILILLVISFYVYSVQCIIYSTIRVFRIDYSSGEYNILPLCVSNLDRHGSNFKMISLKLVCPVSRFLITWGVPLYTMYTLNFRFICRWLHCD